MRKSIFIGTLIASLLLVSCSNEKQKDIKEEVTKNTSEQSEINIVTDRSDFHLTQLVKDFEEENNIKVNMSVIDWWLLEKIEMWKDWDIFIAKNSTDILQASKKELLWNISGYVENTPDYNKWKDWYNFSHRVRWIAFKKWIKDYPTSYEELADPKFEWKICIRPLGHNYNIELLSYIYIEYWEDFFKKWLNSFTKNLAKEPSWNDRAQVKFLVEGKCDIAILNTYYIWLMDDNEEQTNWVEDIDYIIPWQWDNDMWAVSLYSAIWVKKWVEDNEDVKKFIEYTQRVEVQEKISEVNYEYPIIWDDKSWLSKYFVNEEINSSKDIKYTKITQQDLIDNNIREKILLLIKTQ